MVEPLDGKIRAACGKNAIIASINNTPLQDAEDKEVVAYATKHNYIVVTTEKHMDEHQFEICTHPGIIILGGKSRHEAIHGGYFEKFWRSGHRRKANHAVTHLTEGQARIVSKKDGKLVEHIYMLE